MLNRFSSKLSTSLSVVALVLMFMTSCSYRSQNSLLNTNQRPRGDQDVYVINRNTISDTGYVHKIKSGDRIAVKFLNNYDLTKSTFNVDANPTIEAGYVVDGNGFTNMPLVGKVQLNGLSREQASK